MPLIAGADRTQPCEAPIQGSLRKASWYNIPPNPKLMPKELTGLRKSLTDNYCDPHLDDGWFLAC
jgi:hypothetical protein